MLVLIAESKTMTACSDAVSREWYDAHSPLLEVDADAVMESLRDMDAGELSRVVKISPVLAVRLRGMIYEFPDKNVGCAAIEAFTGVVFRALDYPTLCEEARKRLCKCVRMVSSLYGWLRPDDVVKPYRFDFTTPLAPGRQTFAAYWRDKVTACLLAEISSGNHRDVLNLLPGDAARCIDWKRVESQANVWKADFREMLSGGTTRTPNAGKLKTLRGQLLRQILTENITIVQHLTTLTGTQYMASGISAPGTILFHTI